MIILRSEYKCSKEEIEELERRLSAKLKDDVVVIPKGISILAEVRSNSRIVVNDKVNEFA
ncbi:hypothetical protein WHY21_11180 [Clostridium perfringens]|uniref:hypothetical protein n=1 Tax=Clostridium perfringens TaxID=1502 RepID=UPI001D12F0FF|nr:hypothetical protein [Clostridium perfringens]MCC2764588.1 hypothetical protein [Clostridium perfringens]MCG4541239.1 hypothetical protein [Clostridium perfringens]MCG4544413.1 hypothetical protein [Clostridium perfringens]MCG4552278.1 hypothetical protein [Clostridium perfringens]MCG4555761.1 hypothetical protein [Clostridium perfringens]